MNLNKTLTKDLKYIFLNYKPSKSECWRAPNIPTRLVRKLKVTKKEVLKGEKNIFINEKAKMLKH